VNDYEARQERRRERLEARAERLRAEATRRYAGAREISSHIPFGQPILVGHHSEGRHRRDLERINRGYDAAFAASKRAGELEARAESVGTGGISSDDPNAPDKLREKIAELRARQEAMKEANRIARAFPGGQARHPTWQLSNNLANLKRYEARLAQVERLAEAQRQVEEGERELVEKTVAGVRVLENVELNRLQLFFPGKPSEEIRRELKGRGFRWSPSEGAWQRNLGNGARWAAEGVLAKLQGEG
jgi:hypothetical protein